MFSPKEGLDSGELFEFYYSVNRYCIQFGGMVRMMGIFPDRAWVNKLLFVLTIISLNFLAVPQCYAIITQPTNMAEILEAVDIDLVALDIMSKSMVLLYKRGAVIKQEETWKSLWKATVSSEELALLISYGKRGKAMTYCWLCIVGMSIATYLIGPLIIGSRNNFANGVKFPFPIAIEFESTVTLVCYYAAQSFAMTTIFLAVAGTDLIAPVLLFHACGHLKVLQLKLHNLGKNLTMPMKLLSSRNGNEIVLAERNKSETYNSVASSLKECIKRHQDILNACAELENTFNLLALVEAVCTAWHICLAGIALLLAPEETFKFCVHLSCSFYHLFVYCWSADNLTAESLEIANSVFYIPWYHCSRSVQIDALIMISRAQKSCQYTAGGYFAVSLETYATIVSNAFSTFAVLHTLL